MSSWVAEQRQEAFNLYRKYLAMGLHFREGSGYDFSAYGGSTNATLQSFMKKPPQEILKFVSLNNRLNQNAIRPAEFLLANARVSSLNIHQLLLPISMWHYENWKKTYGDRPTFVNTVRNTLTEVKGEHTFEVPSVVEVAKYLILLYTRRGEEKYLEVVAWLLHLAEDKLEQIFKEVKEDIFQHMVFEKARKVQKIYEYLCIL